MQVKSESYKKSSGCSILDTRFLILDGQMLAKYWPNPGRFGPDMSTGGRRLCREYLDIGYSLLDIGYLIEPAARLYLAGAGMTTANKLNIEYSVLIIEYFLDAFNASLHYCGPTLFCGISSGRTHGSAPTFIVFGDQSAR